MVSVRVYVDKTHVGPLFTRNNKALSAEQYRAAKEAAQDAAEIFKKEGDQDITSAGRFGKRWTDAFTVDVSAGGGSIKIEAKLGIFYWRVFEYGATINGKPLLWIPLSFAQDAQGVRARDYPGQLFRVDRKNGAPLLMARSGKGPAEAKYFGKESVRIPKKFHLGQIAVKVAKRMRQLYLERFNNG